MQSKLFQRQVGDKMQLKTIEVQVNSDNEQDFEEERSFQALAGFLSERQSEINVNLEEAEFESESSKNQSIQDKITKL